MLTGYEQFLSTLTERITALAKEENASNILIEIDSKYSYAKKLFELISKPRRDSRSSNDPELRDDELARLLAPFVKFLSDRWQDIKRTDASYCHNPNTFISNVCLITAEELAKLLGGHAFEYLMPPLKCKDYQFPSRDNCDLSGLKLNEFILNEDDQPIFIAECLEEAFKNKSTKLYCIDADMRSKRELSKAELDRVRGHSQECRHYYEAIMDSIRQGNMVIDPKVKKNFQKKYGLGIYKVTSSYGREGRLKLLASILAPIKNRDDLVEVLTKYLKPERWKRFLAQIKNDEFSRYMLGVNTTLLRQKYFDEQSYTQAWLADANPKFTELMREKITTLQDLTAINAMSACCAEMYRRLRKDGPDYKTTSGQVGASVIGLFGWMPLAPIPIPKPQKVLGSYILFIFFTANLPPSKFDDFVHEFMKNVNIEKMNGTTALDAAKEEPAVCKGLQPDEKERTVRVIASGLKDLHAEEIASLKALKAEDLIKIIRSGELGSVLTKATLMYSMMAETQANVASAVNSM